MLLAGQVSAKDNTEWKKRLKLVQKYISKLKLANAWHLYHYEISFDYNVVTLYSSVICSISDMYQKRYGHNSMVKWSNTVVQDYNAEINYSDTLHWNSEGTHCIDTMRRYSAVTESNDYKKNTQACIQICF